MLFKRTKVCVQYLIWLMFTVFVVGLSANCGVKPHPLHHLWGLRDVGSEPQYEKVSIKIQLHWTHRSFLLCLWCLAYLVATGSFSSPRHPLAARIDWNSRQLLSRDIAYGEDLGFLNRQAGARDILGAIPARDVSYRILLHWIGQVTKANGMRVRQTTCLWPQFQEVNGAFAWPQKRAPNA